MLKLEETSFVERRKGEPMNNCMTFPDTVEEFMEQNKVVDTEQIYSNGTEFVPIFRMKQWFEHLPSAEQERKTGKWVYKTTDAYIQRTCSACGWSERMYYCNRNQDGLIRNYCPNCGAKMDGGADNG